MNQFPKQLSALALTLTYSLQLLQPAFAAEAGADVYPAPPLPPLDAFAPQWKAPEPTLTGTSKMPVALNRVPSTPFKGFSADATLEEVDSVGLTQVPLKSPRQDKSKPLRDDRLKVFLKDHHQKGGVMDVGSIGRLETFLTDNASSPFR